MGLPCLQRLGGAWLGSRADYHHIYKVRTCCCPYFLGWMEEHGEGCMYGLPTPTYGKKKIKNQSLPKTHTRNTTSASSNESSFGGQRYFSLHTRNLNVSKILTACLPWQKKTYIYRSIYITRSVANNSNKKRLPHTWKLYMNNFPPPPLKKKNGLTTSFTRQDG